MGIGKGDKSEKEISSLANRRGGSASGATDDERRERLARTLSLCLKFAVGCTQQLVEIQRDKDADLFRLVLGILLSPVFLEANDSEKAAFLRADKCTLRAALEKRGWLPGGHYSVSTVEPDGEEHKLLELQSPGSDGDGAGFSSDRADASPAECVKPLPGDASAQDYEGMSDDELKREAVDRSSYVIKLGQQQLELAEKLERCIRDKRLASSVYAKVEAERKKLDAEYDQCCRNRDVFITELAKRQRKGTLSTRR